VEAALDAVRPAAEAKGIHLQSVLDRQAGPITGDPDRLQQVVWNLLINAVKFTPSGGRVQVHLQRAPSRVEIVVTDSGEGIAPEVLPVIFERFRQADSSITRSYGGLGLGLAIARHLVELHGGGVRAESAGEGKGSCFTVTLPLAAGAVDERPGGPLPPPPRLDGVRVLLVDDDADTLDLVAEIIRGQGARVATASSARAALAQLEGELPDVLVTDVAMPEQDGVALLETMRRRGWQVPAVALTALAREEDRSRAMAAGFERYLVKPVNPGELLSSIAGLVAAPAAGAEVRASGEV
jgi:hypothetical protein